MPTRDEYLRYADDCISLANSSADHETRARLLEMARSWRTLADKAAKRAPKTSPLEAPQILIKRSYSCSQR